jgi:hypothetical protein
MKAKEFDRRFDRGEDISHLVECSKSQRPALEHRRISINLPVWMIRLLDHEAQRLGIDRQSIIKMWLAEKLKPVSTRV